jgi:hypothetical protein
MEKLFGELHKGKTNGSILLHFAFVTGEYKVSPGAASQKLKAQKAE